MKFSVISIIFNLVKKRLSRFGRQCDSWCGRRDDYDGGGGNGYDDRGDGVGNGDADDGRGGGDFAYYGDCLSFFKYILVSGQ